MIKKILIANYGEITRTMGFQTVAFISMLAKAGPVLPLPPQRLWRADRSHGRGSDVETVCACARAWDDLFFNPLSLGRGRIRAANYG